jgi:hypothetical protein
MSFFQRTTEVHPVPGSYRFVRIQGEEPIDGEYFIFNGGDRLMGSRLVFYADARDYDLQFLSKILPEDLVETVGAFVQPVPPKIPEDCAIEFLDGIAVWKQSSFGGTFERAENFNAWYYYPEYPLFRGIGIPIISNGFHMKLSSIPPNAYLEFAWASEGPVIRRALYQEKIVLPVPGQNKNFVFRHRSFSIEE